MRQAQLNALTNSFMNPRDEDFTNPEDPDDDHWLNSLPPNWNPKNPSSSSGSGGAQVKVSKFGVKKMASSSSRVDPAVEAFARSTGAGTTRMTKTTKTSSTASSKKSGGGLDLDFDEQALAKKVAELRTRDVCS